MELLREIQNAIKSLDTQPQEIDLQHVKHILSVAYEAAHDGLNRSHAAEGLHPALKKIAILEEQLNDAIADSERLEIALHESEALSGALRPILEDMRNQLKGKIALIPSYSAEMKQNLSEQIEGADGEEIVNLKTRIEHDFRQAFLAPSKAPTPLTAGSRHFFNHKLYQSQGA